MDSKRGMGRDISEPSSDQAGNDAHVTEHADLYESSQADTLSSGTLPTLSPAPELSESYDGDPDMGLGEFQALVGAFSNDIRTKRPEVAALLDFAQGNEQEQNILLAGTKKEIAGALVSAELNVSETHFVTYYHNRERYSALSVSAQSSILNETIESFFAQKASNNPAVLARGDFHCFPENIPGFSFVVDARNRHAEQHGLDEDPIATQNMVSNWRINVFPEFIRSGQVVESVRKGAVRKIIQPVTEIAAKPEVKKSLESSYVLAV